MRRLILCLCLLVALAEPAAAERRVALVIGNSTYTAVTHLPNPVNDADDIAAALRRIGFTVSLTKDLDFNGFRRALRDFGDAAVGADMAVVFYAGHGLELDGRNYLVPTDAALKSDRDVPLEAIGLDSVTDAVAGARGLRLVLLDACRNNPLAAAMRLTRSTRSVSRGLARVNPVPGVLVGYAAREGTVAADGQGRNSPFTAALLAHLEEPGVEIRLFLGKVHDSVMEATSDTQEPFTYGALGGKSIFLVSPKPGEEAGVSGLAADYALAERIGSIAAWDAFLARHAGEPGDFHVQLARAAREKLAAAVAPDKAETQKLEKAPATGEVGKLETSNLPAEVVLDPEMVKLANTNPFFSGAPPLRLHAYESSHRSAEKNTAMERTVRLDTASGALVSMDQAFSYASDWYAGGRYENHTQTRSVLAGNGLFSIGAFSLSTTRIPGSPEERRTNTFVAYRIELSGTVFPLDIGRSFSYRISGRHTPSDFGESVTETTCEVERALDAALFHENLTGKAIVVGCKRAVSWSKPGSKPSETTVKRIFFEALGTWVEADPKAPEKPILGTNFVLKSFELAGQ
ncbi:MAG: caspase domain-containing protein [Parvibaculaceae bacterium]